MGFDQAYYTSCEHGLSNRAGYQFNAASPGIPPEVLSDVEALTSYSPPRSVSYTAGAAEIAGSPVNLCYRPGRSTILANVVFVGNDFSRRFGNYFAHALITEDPDRELGPVLPIEWWRAPFWARVPTADPALPQLLAPPPEHGALSRSAVAGFVGNHECADRIAALVTAVGMAVTRRERKVVIVERTADATAHWIAAVSYLLPVELVRAMSFATYENEPRYSVHAVVGTVPDTGFEADERAFETDYVFDMINGRASELTVHPLAELLADIGVESAADAWARSRRLAAGSEHELDHWHPVLAATLVGRGLGYAEDAVAVANWLRGNAERLGVEAVTDIGQRVLPLLAGADNPAEPLGALTTAARLARADALAAEVELAWVETMIESDPAALDDEPIRSPRARSAARDALDSRLRLATADDAVALLSWARRAGVDATGDTLRHTGKTVLGAAVLTRHEDEALLSLLRDWPSLRIGVVDHLATVAVSQLDEVIEVLCGSAGELFDVYDRPQLWEAATIVSVRSGDVPPAEALVRIVADRGELRPGLLDLLWPGGEWSADEACHVMLHLDPAFVVDPLVADWLIRVLRAEPRDDAGSESTDALDRLCDAVSSNPIFDMLPADLTRAVRARRDVLLLVEGLLNSPPRQFQRYLDELHQNYQRFDGTKQAAVASKLVAQADRLDAGELAFLLARFTRVRDAFLKALQTTRDREEAVHMLTQLLGAVGELKRLRSTHRDLRKPHIEIETATIAILRTWRRRDLRRAAELLDQQGEQYMAWWLRDQRGGLTWLPNKWGRATTPPPLTRPKPRTGR